jgi:Uma2 family endonuclease
MGMATSTRVSLEEYFRTHYEPECELIDGELRPKPMPTGHHSSTQVELIVLLRAQEQLGRGRVWSELSLLLPSQAVLIPDVVFSRPGQRFDEHDVLNTPPLLCIEIISPSQSFRELYDKCISYLRWGVPYCWIIDPVRHLAWQIEVDEMPREIFSGGSLRAGDIEVKLADLFSASE